MTEFQRLFLVQARADFAVFELLRKEPGLSRCHALHYLQMSTELLGKAYVWRNGFPGKNTHRAFVQFLRSLPFNRAAQKQLGKQGKNNAWEQIIRKNVPLAERIEDLAPALAQDGPNPEYPWPSEKPVIAPVEHEFSLWAILENKTEGRKFIELVQKLFAAADAYL